MMFYASMLKILRAIRRAVFLATLIATAQSSCMAADSEPNVHAPLECQKGMPIDESATFRSSGTPLYYLVESSDCTKPLLVWLHGGPGAAERPLFRLYDSALERNFTVIYWDQRGAGRSWNEDESPAKLSMSQSLADLKKLIEILKSRYGQDKALLIGHSWGAALAMNYLAGHPSDVAGVVAVNPLVRGMESEKAQQDFVRGAAGKAGDEDILQQLENLGSPPYGGSNLLKLQGLVDRYGGQFHHKPSFVLATAKALLKGYVTPAEIFTIIHANEATLKAMAGQVSEIDLEKSAPSVEAPVVFMLGRYDHILSPQISKRYLDELVAPSKKAIWFDESAHNIPFEEPDKFVEAVESFGSKLLQHSR